MSGRSQKEYTESQADPLKSRREVDDFTFKAWLEQAERNCGARCGLDLDSLGDGPSWSCWDAGLTPHEYVSERLEAADYPEELMA